jgi:hypothetical protein
MQQIDRKVVGKIAFAYPYVWSDLFEVFHDFVLVMKIKPLLFFFQVPLRYHFKPRLTLKINRNSVSREFEQFGKFVNVVFFNIKVFREL